MPKRWGELLEEVVRVIRHLNKEPIAEQGICLTARQRARDRLRGADDLTLGALKLIKEARPLFISVTNQVLSRAAINRDAQAGRGINVVADRRREVAEERLFHILDLNLFGNGGPLRNAAKLDLAAGDTVLVRGKRLIANHIDAVGEVMVLELDEVALVDLDRLTLKHTRDTVISIVKAERDKGRGARTVDEDVSTRDIRLEGHAAEGHAKLDAVLHVRLEARQLLVDKVGARTAVSRDRHFRGDDLRELLRDRSRKAERFDLVVGPLRLIDVHAVPPTNGARHFIADERVRIEALINHIGRHKHISRKCTELSPKVI